MARLRMENEFLKKQRVRGSIAIISLARRIAAFTRLCTRAGVEPN